MAIKNSEELRTVINTLIELVYDQRSMILELQVKAGLITQEDSDTAKAHLGGKREKLSDSLYSVELD